MNALELVRYQQRMKLAGGIADSKYGMYLLMQEIAIIEPEYILLMGTEAVKAMFGRKASQDKMRSQAFFVPGLRAHHSAGGPDLAQ